MRDHVGDIYFARADPLQRLAGAGVIGIAGGVHDGFGAERLPEEFQVREAHPLEAGHAKQEDEAVVTDDIDRQRDGGFFAGGFDDDIGQCATRSAREWRPVASHWHYEACLWRRSVGCRRGDILSSRGR